MYKKGITLYLLDGNHDQAGTNVGTEHSLKPFGLFCKLLDKPGFTDVGGFRIFHCPYFQKETDAAKQIEGLIKEHKPDPTSDIVAFHQGVSGARISPADFLLQDLKLETLNQDAFMHTFLGHYHLPQNMSADAEYVGATMQHTWQDAGQTNRGFIDYDVSSGLSKRIPIKAPGFYDLKQADLDTFDFLKHLKDFIRIEVGASFTLDDQKSLISQYPDDTYIKFIPAPLEADTSSGVTLSLSMTKADILEAYVDSGVQSIGDLDPEVIKTAGRYLVNGSKWPVLNGRQVVVNETD
jgi:DNA repair exonuclease SbcCD nuclease subunit